MKRMHVQVYIGGAAVALLLMIYKCIHLKANDVTPMTSVAKKPYDWILTSYKRSGSSIKGRILGYRDDTFYWFEPFFALQSHFWSDDKVCFHDFDGQNCRHPTRQEPTTQKTVSMVRAIFSCNFSMLRDIVTNDFFSEKYSANDVSPLRPVAKKTYDWILTSYKRSGSSITGRILGHRDDTFYWFEPLYSYDANFWSEDKVCFNDLDGENCRIPTGLEPTTQKVVSMVQGILSCNFSMLRDFLNSFTEEKYSGVHWIPFEECTHGIQDIGVLMRCLVQQETLCKSTKHRGVKLLRLVVDNVVSLLRTNENLKVIHLFRDPRAILHSRETTVWYRFQRFYGVTSFDAKIQDAYLLCTRMLREARAAKMLRRVFPGRFAIIMYEDLFMNRNQKLKQVYSFLNIAMTEQDWANFSVGMIDKNNQTYTRTESDKDFINWWRSEMDYSLVREIDTVCNDVYKALGFIPVKDKRMMTNKSLKLYNFKRDILIEEMSSGKPYESIELLD